MDDEEPDVRVCARFSLPTERLCAAFRFFATAACGSCGGTTARLPRRSEVAIADAKGILVTDDELIIRCSIVVSISACHAEYPGSIPGGGISTEGCAPISCRVDSPRQARAADEQPARNFGVEKWEKRRQGAGKACCWKQGSLSSALLSPAAFHILGQSRGHGCGHVQGRDPVRAVVTPLSPRCHCGPIVTPSWPDGDVVVIVSRAHCGWPHPVVVHCGPIVVPL